MKSQNEIEAAIAEGISLHHDISTITGEDFTLAESPLFREAKKR
jgi:hypothetical protein